MSDPKTSEQVEQTIAALLPHLREHLTFLVSRQASGSAGFTVHLDRGRLGKWDITPKETVRLWRTQQ